MPAYGEGLTILGYRGEAVPNEFLKQESETDHLALMLPGLGYTCDMPLFYYAEIVCLEAGADVLRVEYDYRRAGFMQIPEDVRRQRLHDDAGAGLRAGLAQRAYRRVTLIGKSLGTLALGRLLPEVSLPEDVRVIWLTPILRDEMVLGEIRRRASASLVVIGTEDADFDAGRLEGLGGAGAEVVTIQGADHSLDIPGDPVASVRALELVIAAIQAAAS